MRIQLSETAEALALEAVGRGAAATVAEALERALQIMAFHDADRTLAWDRAHVAEVNELVEAGLSQLARGEGIPAELVIERGRDLVREKTNRRTLAG